MQKYSKILLDSIEREKAGKDFFCNGPDKELLRNLLREINDYAGTNFQYLAELASFSIPGTGEIIAHHIQTFSSESVRGYLVPQLVSDKVKDCDKLVFELYMHFKTSCEYISEPGHPAPAHIYTRYDNAMSSLKPKRLKANLVRLAYYPRDFFYLPFTMKMLASWKIPEIKDILMQYSSETSISENDVGIMDKCKAYLPPFSFIKRELRLTAIDCLKNYPSVETIEILEKYTADADSDICMVARKTLRKLTKQ